MGELMGLEGVEGARSLGRGSPSPRAVGTWGKGPVGVVGPAHGPLSAPLGAGSGRVAREAAGPFSQPVATGEQ